METVSTRDVPGASLVDIHQTAATAGHQEKPQSLANALTSMKEFLIGSIHSITTATATGPKDMAQTRAAVDVAVPSLAALVVPTMHPPRAPGEPAPPELLIAPTTAAAKQAAIQAGMQAAIRAAIRAAIQAVAIAAALIQAAVIAAALIWAAVMAL